MPFINYINFKLIIIGESEASSSQLSQPTLPILFNNYITPRQESFNINLFKRLLLNFLVNNNISFRVITTPSFK